jgi:hypothetical protein
MQRVWTLKDKYPIRTSRRPSEWVVADHFFTNLNDPGQVLRELDEAATANGAGPTDDGSSSNESDLPDLVQRGRTSSSSSSDSDGIDRRRGYCPRYSPSPSNSPQGNRYTTPVAARAQDTTFPYVPTVTSSAAHDANLSLISEFGNQIGAQFGHLKDVHEYQLLTKQRMDDIGKLDEMPAPLDNSALYRWVLGVKRGLVGVHWECTVDGQLQNIALVSTTDKANREMTDTSRDMAKALRMATQKNDTVRSLLERRPELNTYGPELLEAIIEAFMPSDLTHYRQRLSSFYDTCQGNLEWATQYLLRLQFMGARLLACDGQAIDDGTLKRLFYRGVLGGFYYDCLKSTLRKLQEAGGTNRRTCLSRVRFVSLTLTHSVPLLILLILLQQTAVDSSSVTS